MTEEDISKVLSGETDVSTMGDAEFNELIKALRNVYFARVMNCVDPTGKSDKEWLALSSVFHRLSTSGKD